MALMISSPGGDGLSAERIVNLCRSYSGTGEFWAIVPGKAKSAATMICFGASRIIMGPSSELGPVDPQLIFRSEDGTRKQFSAHNLVNSYDSLFSRAVDTQGHLEPFLQQLQNYDERDIQEFRSIIELAEDISIRTLKSGMMSRMNEDTIRKRIERFLTPKQTKSHGRPIFRGEATDCGLQVELVDVRARMWGDVYELYIRSNEFVSTRHMKCIESIDDSFTVSAPSH
jgi:ClpP class serine protease